MGLTEEQVRARARERKAELVSPWTGNMADEHSFRCLTDESHEEWRVPARRLLARIDYAGCPECRKPGGMLTTRTVEKRLAKRKLTLRGEWAGSHKDYTLGCLAELGHADFPLGGNAVLQAYVECPLCRDIRMAAQKAKRAAKKRPRRTGGSSLRRTTRRVPSMPKID